MSGWSIALALVLGLGAGVLSGLFGVGGGLLFVPTLLGLGLGQLEAESTSLLAILPTAAVGAWRQQRYGNLRVRPALLVGVASVAGVGIGALIATSLPEHALRRLFGWLKDKGVTAVITAEQGDGTLTRHGLEEYVSDCVILLDHRVRDQISTRRLRVVKYRGSSHGTNEYPFVIDSGGPQVIQQMKALGLFDAGAKFMGPDGLYSPALVEQATRGEHVQRHQPGAGADGEPDAEHGRGRGGEPGRPGVEAAAGQQRGGGLGDQQSAGQARDP